MGTSAGPSLQGIGRGGASNLVLEMDAHDAKSYPGEPTLNVMKNGYFPGTDTTTTSSGWAINGTAGIVTFRGGGEEFFYQGLGLSNPRVLKLNGVGYYNDTNSGYIVQSNAPNETSTVYAISFWYRFTGQNSAQLSNQYIKLDLDGGITDPGNPLYTDYGDTEWHYYSQLKTSHASTSLFTVYFYGNTYSNCPGGSYYEIAGFQVEAKGYSTPFVGDGQFARPASVNLMIHGNVGTGQSFSDSSPDKNVITALGDVTHSAAQSKFSGGSIYFDGTTDALRMPPSESWAFGTADWTADFWHYRLAMVSWSTFLDTYSDGSGTNDGFLIGYYSNTNQLAFYSENTSTWNYAGGSTLAADTWYHIAYVRSGNNLKIYLNGVVDQSFTLSASDTYSSQYLYVGSRAASQYINGYMDEVRITKGTALWTADFTPPTRRNLSAPVVDRSGNHNGGNFATTDMTDVSTYRVGEVIRPIDSAVWDFDGTDDIISTSFGNGHNPSTSPITYSFWVKQDSLTDEMFAVQGNWLVGSQRAYFGSLASYWNMGVEATGWGNTAATRGDAITAGVWVNVVIVFTGTAAKMYNNGIYKYEIAYSSYTFNQNLEIGGTAAGSYDWDGKIGAVAVFDKALTDQQIVENFNQQRSRFNI